ncbi:hypothetical protein Tco_0984009, partial [Tanacetum coccineum]
IMGEPLSPDRVFDFPMDEPEPIVEEVDIIKKTENQAKMTKLSMEWKDCANIKAKVQNARSEVNTEESASQTGAELKNYCWMQS